MERHMRPGSREFATYRADCKAYLEFCQDHRVQGALSEFALYCWIACLEGEGVLAVDRARMRASVETLFRHIGVLPDNEPDDLQLASDEHPC